VRECVETVRKKRKEKTQTEAPVPEAAEVQV